MRTKYKSRVFIVLPIFTLLITLTDIALFHLWYVPEHFGIDKHIYLMLIFVSLIFSFGVFVSILEPKLTSQAFGVSFITLALENVLFFLIVEWDPLVKDFYWVWGFEDGPMYTVPFWEFWAATIGLIGLGLFLISRPIKHARPTSSLSPYK